LFGDSLNAGQVLNGVNKVHANFYQAI